MSSLVGDLLLMMTPEEQETVLLIELLDSHGHGSSNGEHLKYGRMTKQQFDGLSDDECWSRFRYESRSSHFTTLVVEAFLHRNI